MNNKIKNIIIFSVVGFLATIFFTTSVYANGLSITVEKECDIKYMGERCIVEMTIQNTTGKILDGEAIFHVDFEESNFDGSGITPYFSIKDGGWLNFGTWANGDTSTGKIFSIEKGENLSKLEINTHHALYPGNYKFSLRLEGSYVEEEEEEEEEEYDSLPIDIGGGGTGHSGTAAFCGDGDLDEFKGEECDDGNNVDGDGCSSNCKIEKEGEVKGESTEGEEEEAGDGEQGDSSTSAQDEKKGEVAGAETKESEDKKETEEESKKNWFSAFIINLITFNLNNIWIILLFLLMLLAILIYYFKRKEKKKEF